MRMFMHTRPVPGRQSRLKGTRIRIVFIVVVVVVADPYSQGTEMTANGNGFENNVLNGQNSLGSNRKQNAAADERRIDKSRERERQREKGK